MGGGMYLLTNPRKHALDRGGSLGSRLFQPAPRRTPVTPIREPFHVGLIGYGLAGESFHAPFIATTPGLRLAVVVTGNPDRGARPYGHIPMRPSSNRHHTSGSARAISMSS